MNEKLTHPEEAQLKVPGTEDDAAQAAIPQWEPAALESGTGQDDDSTAVSRVDGTKSQTESQATGGEPPAVGGQSSRSFLDDALGGFDPRIHAADENGDPILTKTGEYARKRGRKKGANVTSEANHENVPRETPPAKDATNVDPQVTTQKVVMATTKGSKEAAKMIAAIFVVSTSKIIGEEWRPEDKAEMKMLEEATENYLNAIGGVEMSPGLGMICAYGMYSLARMGHENTQSKASKFWGWTKAKMVRAYLWVRGK